MRLRDELARCGSGMSLLLAVAWLAALAPSLPLGLSLGASVAAWPGGELTLGEPGGVLLLEALRSSARELAVAARLGPAWLCAAALVTVVPQGALAAQLAWPIRLPLLLALATATRRLPSLLAIAAAHLLSRVALVAAAVFFATMTTIVTSSRAGELVVFAIFAVVAAAIACALRLVADVAVVRALRADVGAGDALLDALGALSLRAFSEVLGAAALGAVTFGGAVWLAHEIGARTPAEAAVSATLRAGSLAALVAARAVALGVAARSAT
ncbi:MAG: hypothetical protein IT374_16740 [Polyangiaceae bacterium]|nr:hypothetical protein [Polyangiaceae bacterium]